MTTFFKPSDISTIVCTVNNMTRGGSAFAVTEAGEQVFISPKIAEQMQIGPGDMVTAYCIDNHKPEMERSYSARWRAIRIKPVERFAPVEPEAAPARTVDLGDQLDRLFDAEPSRAYNGTQLAQMLGVDQAKVSNWLNHHHEYGRLVAAKLYKSGDQDRASKVYFARTMIAFEKAFAS